MVLNLQWHSTCLFVSIQGAWFPSKHFKTEKEKYKLVCFTYGDCLLPQSHHKTKMEQCSNTALEGEPLDWYCFILFKYGYVPQFTDNKIKEFQLSKPGNFLKEVYAATKCWFHFKLIHPRLETRPSTFILNIITLSLYYGSCHLLKTVVIQ